MPTVVTSENLAEFNQARLGLTIGQTPEPPEPETPKPAEPPEEPPKEGHGKPKISERFSELTNQRKAAEDARKVAEEAKAAAEARAEAAEKRAKELEDAQKAPKPPPFDPELGPEPKPSDYTDAFKYAADLAEWKSQAGIKKWQQDQIEAQKKHEAEKVVQAHWKRVAAAQKEFPDYQETMDGAKNLTLTEREVQNAVIESDMSAKILYHLAKNPDEVGKINDMSVRGALRYLGKLESQLEKPAPTPAPAVQQRRPAPPEPIEPIRAMGTGTNQQIDAAGEFTGTYAQWKALRKAKKV
jgi:hypothetical protein